MRTKHGRAIRRCIGAAVLAGGVVLGAAAPAHAEVIDHEHYAGTETFTHTECGFPVVEEVEFSGVFHLRVGKGAQESVFYLHDNFEFRSVVTNPANGNFIVIWGNGLFHETRAVPLGGDLFQFTAIEAGRPFNLEDSEGNLILRDRGVIVRTIVFDTEGDDVPGGIFIEDVSVVVHGPHPGFDGGFEVACELLAGA